MEKIIAKIQGILMNSSQKSVIGWAVEEADFEDVAKEIVKKCFIHDVVVPKVTLCECMGNERVALDCTMKPCKHPKYFKG